VNSFMNALWLILGGAFVTLGVWFLTNKFRQMSRTAIQDFFDIAIVPGDEVRTKELISSQVLYVTRMLAQRGVWFLNRIAQAEGREAVELIRYFKKAGEITAEDGKILVPRELFNHGLKSPAITDPKLRSEWRRFFRLWRTLQGFLLALPRYLPIEMKRLG